jgi:hypothetical protein
MLRVNLKNNRALGKNKNFIKLSKYQSASSAVSDDQSGEGFKSVNNKINDIAGNTGKKLNKFINFKL